MYKNPQDTKILPTRKASIANVFAIAMIAILTAGCKKDGLAALGAVGGIATAIAIVNQIDAQQKTAQQDEAQRKDLERQTKNEEQAAAMAQKRQQEQEAYDKWFLSLSKDEQYKELKMREKNSQRVAEQGRHLINLATDIGEAVTAPRVKVYSAW